jgi:hypothetical protein
MCLNGEGAGCKVVVGRGSGGRLRHGLRSRSAWENEKIWSSILIEPHLAKKSGGNRSISTQNTQERGQGWAPTDTPTICFAHFYDVQRIQK